MAPWALKAVVSQCCSWKPSTYPQNHPFTSVRRNDPLQHPSAYPLPTDHSSVKIRQRLSGHLQPPLQLTYLHQLGVANWGTSTWSSDLLKNVFKWKMNSNVIKNWKKKIHSVHLHQGNFLQCAHFLFPIPYLPQYQFLPLSNHPFILDRRVCRMSGTKTKMGHY